jgi:methylglutaconyl-CoA hydratase
MARAHELAATLIEHSPTGITRTKQLLRDSAAEQVDRDLERAIAENVRIRATADFREGLASFLEKRRPVWSGR